ncbi:MAG: hypothetical protein JSR55_14580 [Proteobacteria bacterium]|nr:hypothetical protein [Pseudomonadota bacterium]
MEEGDGKVVRGTELMRLWQHFKTLKGALGATSALIAILFGLTVLMDVGARWHADATNTPDFWNYVAFDLVFGLVPLAGGLIALWRGSLIALVVSWAFTTGLVTADFIKFLAFLVAEAQHPNKGIYDISSPNILSGSMAFVVSMFGLLLAWLSIKSANRKRADQSSSS